MEKGNQIINHLRRQADEQFVDIKGNKLIGGRSSSLHRKSPFKLRWALMQDGDLWEVFAEMVKTRGPHSVTITKVKGHADQTHVTSGICTERQRWGNDVADGLADVAMTKHPIFVRQYCQIMVDRQDRYAALALTVQHLLVRVGTVMLDRYKAYTKVAPSTEKIVRLGAGLKPSKNLFFPLGSALSEMMSHFSIFLSVTLRLALTLMTFSA